MIVSLSLRQDRFIDRPLPFYSTGMERRRVCFWPKYVSLLYLRTAGGRSFGLNGEVVRNEYLILILTKSSFIRYPVTHLLGMICGLISNEMEYLISINCSC